MKKLRIIFLTAILLGVCIGISACINKHGGLSGVWHSEPTNCNYTDLETEDGDFDFLSAIVELYDTIEFNVNNEFSGIDLTDFDFGSKVKEAINNISAETEPFVELPSLNDCLNKVVGKIKIADSYLIVVSSTDCELGYKTVTGIELKKSEQIGGAIVLASYYVGTGASQELSSKLIGTLLEQEVIESSWSWGVEPTTLKTLYSAEIKAVDEKLVASYQ